MISNTININPVELLEFRSLKRTPLILQVEVAECGLAAVAMIASYHGHKLDMAAMRKRFSSNLKGTNLQQLIDLGDSLDLASRALKCPIDSIGDLSLPCILHWDMNHFVVLTKVGKSKVTINDPAIGKRTLSMAELGEHYTGISLEFAPTSKFEKQNERVKMRLSQLWSKITGIRSALIKLLLLSILMQLFALAMPYYMQWVVDEVLISQDQSLLLVLALGFAILATINMFTTAIRSWLLLRLSSMLNLQMGINLMRHLLRLPMHYYESRHVGDIVSRFGSLSQIRERITNGLVETVIDGFMSIAIFIMMLAYSVELTSVVLVAVSLYSGIRFALYGTLHQITEESIQNRAKEQSNFLENVRGIQTIKQFSNETQRQSIWLNRYSEVINADIRLGKLTISFDAMKSLIFSIENILVVYVGSMIFINGDISVGMLLAFIAYKLQFTERVSNLIQQLIEFRMMRLHLERIADIALHQSELYRDGEPLQAELKGHLSLEGVSYRFSENDPPILNGVSIDVEPGESIAITGASGSGKTTLIKLMLGLLQPTSGVIRIDGHDITHVGLKNYRRKIAAVMQNDTLLAGSIADNIAFFDPEPNYLKIEKCARIASIHDDIIKIPMGYNALVGDMGSNLSGGQVQRIILARALYQDPQILFMDEATSHLDIKNEQKIIKQVQNLSITRICIAHRPETIKNTDKVYRLENGNLELISRRSSRGVAQ